MLQCAKTALENLYSSYYLVFETILKCKIIVPIAEGNHQVSEREITYPTSHSQGSIAHPSDPKFRTPSISLRPAPQKRGLRKGAQGEQKRNNPSSRFFPRPAFPALIIHQSIQ